MVFFFQNSARDFNTQHRPRASALARPQPGSTLVWVPCSGRTRRQLHQNLRLNPGPRFSRQAPMEFQCAPSCENQVSRSAILKLACVRELPGICLNAGSDLFCPGRLRGPTFLMSVQGLSVLLTHGRHFEEQEGLPSRMESSGAAGWLFANYEKRSLCSTANQTPHPAYLVVRLSQDLVIFAQSNQKNNGGDALKAVNPLPSLRSLAANIHHPVSRNTDLSKGRIPDSLEKRGTNHDTVGVSAF